MELRHLRYFAAVADSLNFTQAAARLRVAQPALSRQIRQLEDELGVRLLERDRRHVSLTPAGRTFLTEARAVLERSEQAVRAAQGGQSGGGELNLGYIWGLFHSLVPEVLARFRHAHPQVAVNLFDYPATTQARTIREGRLDAGFLGFTHEADAAGLAKRCVGVCEWVAVLPAGHPAARKSRVPLAALARDFFVAISEDTYPGASREVARACEAAGFRPRILQAAERGFTILGLVAGGCGVALLPESLRALPHRGVVFRPLAHPPRADLFFAWHPARLSPTLSAFLESLPPTISPTTGPCAAPPLAPPWPAPACSPP